MLLLVLYTDILCLLSKNHYPFHILKVEFIRCDTLMLVISLLLHASECFIDIMTAVSDCCYVG